MEHDDVVEQDVASRYLSGGLRPDERAAFEEHFIDCPSCLDALEGADELQRGLRAVAAQDALTDRIQPIRRSRSWRRAMVSAAGIAAAIAIAVGTADVLRTRRELARVSRVAADLNGQSDRAQSLIRSLSERVQQLESAHRPRRSGAGRRSVERAGVRPDDGEGGRDVDAAEPRDAVGHAGVDRLVAGAG